jgi:hypothetical protein
MSHFLSLHAEQLVVFEVSNLWAGGGHDREMTARFKVEHKSSVIPEQGSGS